MKAFVSIVFGAALVFFLSWFIVYRANINTLSIQSEDTIPAMFLPYSIVKKGNIYLDDYYDQMLLRYPQPDDKDYTKGNVPFYLKKVDNRYLSAFTIIAPILALPVYLIPILIGVPSTWYNLIILSHLAEALIMGLAGWVLFLIAHKRIGLSKNKSYLLTTVYLLGTINFAHISQALWQHGSVQLLLLVGLYFYLSIPRKTLSLLLAGFFWGFAFLARPTALLPIALFGLLLLIDNTELKRKFQYGLNLFFGCIPAILFFFWYNNSYYKSFNNQGYGDQLLTSWLGDFPISFLGVWLSPSKGILVYSPILIFSLIGFYLAIKNKDLLLRNLYLVSGLVVFLHTLVISFWKHWYGGWSFGYRMSSDVLPFFALLLLPFVNSFLFNKYKKVFTILLIVSISIQLLGIVFFDGIWHAAYDKGFHDTSWLWSITDSEFMFNIRRVLVKLNLLDRACPQCLTQ